MTPSKVITLKIEFDDLHEYTRQDLLNQIEKRYYPEGLDTTEKEEDVEKKARQIVGEIYIEHNSDEVGTAIYDVPTRIHRLPVDTSKELDTSKVEIQIKGPLPFPWKDC